MKKILGLTIAALLVIGLVGGGTWAYFSDTEESTGNVFSSGTLDLGLANSGGTNPTGSVTATFGANDLAPGSAAGSGTLYVNNEGSINMAMVTVEFSEVDFTDAMLDTVDGWDGSADTDDLRQMIIATTVTWDGSTVSDLQGESIGDIMAMGPVELGSLDADEELVLYIEWTFDATATNGCQGDEIELAIVLTSYQDY